MCEAGVKTWMQIKAETKPIHSKDEVEYKTGCMAKRSIQTKKNAAYIVEEMNRKYNYNFNYYKCKFCKQYHIGRVDDLC